MSAYRPRVGDTARYLPQSGPYRAYSGQECTIADVLEMGVCVVVWTKMADGRLLKLNARQVQILRRGSEKSERDGTAGMPPPAVAAAVACLPSPKRRSKYNAVAVTIDGYRFDSLKEGERYKELKVLAAAGEITNLVVEKAKLRFPFEHNGVLIGHYEADASYTVTATGERIVEDTKSEMTRKLRTYRKNRRLMKAFYGIDVKEVY